MPAPTVETASDFSLEAIRKWPATVGVRTACAALGISGAWGYALIKSGEFPVRTLTIRGRSRVVTSELVALLDAGGAE